MTPRTEHVPDGARVAYHGTKTALHGEHWKVRGLCACRHCRFCGTHCVRFRLVGADGLVIRHVRRESFTTLTHA